MHNGRTAAETRLLPSASEQLHGIPVGTLLVNTYRVERLLGGGGMGEVYLARHTGLGTEHAIKVIRPAMLMNRQVMDLFYREAKVLRGVRQDAVVSYDGFVRDDQGRDYLVMEYAEGPSLSQLLQRGPLVPQRVLALRDRLATGLAEAHRKGAVHRDLSPDNIILPGERIEAAKLIDFGLCKLTDPNQESIIGSSFAGKVRYASPEQFGLFGGQVDARSDIYSLGLVLAAAARGRALDMGDSFESALSSRRKVPNLDAIPAELRDWLRAMLEPDPARRPGSMQAILERWPADTAATKQHQRLRPRLRWASVVLVVVVVLGAIAGGWYWLTRSVPEPMPPDETSSEPASETVDLGELLRSQRLDDAFVMAQERLKAGHPPSRQTLWALTQALQQAEQMDRAFALARELATAGHGPAAFLLAEMYDPLHWSDATSPLSRPNARKALEWYQRAADAGVHEAPRRYDALAAYQRDHQQ